VEESRRYVKMWNLDSMNLWALGALVTTAIFLARALRKAVKRYSIDDDDIWGALIAGEEVIKAAEESGIKADYGSDSST
jgi:hypothetical protein